MAQLTRPHPEEPEAVSNLVGTNDLECSSQSISVHATDTKDDEDEDTDILGWFKDIISDTQSNKNRRNILSETCQQLSENTILSRLTNSKLRKAATTFGKLAHRIDLSYPPKQQLTQIDMTQDTNIQLMKEIKYAVRHALASYKKLKLAFRTKESIIAFKSTKTLLRDYFGIPPTDIIIDNSDRNMQQFRNRLHSPRFYLVIDHKNEKIVLSIRGSATTADRITDINGTAKPFNAFDIDGYAHEGILASSKYIFDNVTIDLVKQCKKYKNYQAVITGHSLGAGVAAVLGFMYYKHPIIYKRNKLKVFAFASPPVLSKEFMDKNMEMDYIISIALSTDFVTRLSIQSVKQHNLRNDLILEYEQNVIDECMRVLDDNMHNLKGKINEFLSRLKLVTAPHPHEQLFPLGRILWFVPNAVMEDDVVCRRKCLMCLDVEEDNKQQNEEEEIKSDNDNIKQRSWSETWNTLLTKMPQIESTRTKNLKQYGEDKYTLCDATECRDIFQEFMVDFPESFLSHLPSRYLWACGTSITD